MTIGPGRRIWDLAAATKLSFERRVLSEAGALSLPTGQKESSRMRTESHPLDVWRFGGNKSQFSEGATAR